MDPIEKAIRAALEKGNADDRAFREKVYLSAHAALDRALKSNPNLTVENAITRRKNLQASIAEIETEYTPATPSDADPGIVPDVAPVTPRNPAGAPPVDLSGTPSRREHIEAPSLDFAADAPVPNAPNRARAPVAEVSADRDPRRAKPRRPFAAMFLIVTILTAGAIGIWWSYQTGLFRSAAEIDTSVPNPPPTLDPEDFTPAPGTAPSLGDADPTRDWINVFSPDDPASVAAPTGAAAEVMQDESGSFLRIRSGAGGAPFSFDVGQGVLEQVAGKKAVFDIIARAEEGKETEMSVECKFGAAGDCGRKRYSVGYEKGEFLFDITAGDQKPNAAGSIAITPDVANQGKAVDIYAIRVSVAP